MKNIKPASISGKGNKTIELEVMQARLEIRDFFLHATVKEIYENIGQVLSFVRMQLAVLTHPSHKLSDELVSYGDLIGKSIQDMRSMSKNFYPDEEILKKDGLVSVLAHTLQMFQFNCTIKDETKAVVKNSSDFSQLLIFRLLLKVLLSLKESGEELKGIRIYEKGLLTLYSLKIINRSGTDVTRLQPYHSQLIRMDATSKIRLLASGNYNLIISVPKNTAL